MTQALTLAAILIVLGANPMELLSGMVRLLVAIVVSALIIALLVGVVITVPNLLMWCLSAIMVASYAIAAVEALNRCRQKLFRHFSTPDSGLVVAPLQEAPGGSTAMASADQRERF